MHLGDTHPGILECFLGVVAERAQPQTNRAPAELPTAPTASTPAPTAPSRYGPWRPHTKATPQEIAKFFGAKPMKL